MVEEYFRDVTCKVQVCVTTMALYRMTGNVCMLYCKYCATVAKCVLAGEEKNWEEKVKRGEDVLGDCESIYVRLPKLHISDVST